MAGSNMNLVKSTRTLEPSVAVVEDSTPARPHWMYFDTSHRIKAAILSVRLGGLWMRITKIAKSLHQN